MNDKFRLHEIEGAVDLYSEDPFIFRPRELYELDEGIRDNFEHYNLYLVARRNRVFIKPDTLHLHKDQQVISGCFGVSIGFETKTVPFHFENNLPLPIAQLGSLEYPYDFLNLVLANGTPMHMTTHDLLKLSKGDLEPYKGLFVEYVGQSFSDDGKRNSIKRLIGKSGKDGHGSLQKVLADINGKYPDNEAFVLLYSFGFYKKMSFGGGFSEPQIPLEKAPERLSHFMDYKLPRENRIDLVEAALIRYFRPEYNDMYKKTFPKKTHTILERLFELDVTGLSVSLSTLDHGVNLYSNKIEASQMHLALYPIVNQKDRASFFDIMLPSPFEA